MDPKNFDKYICNEQEKVQVAKSSSEAAYDKALLDSILTGSYIRILIDLKSGICRAAAWGCDLTYDYVKANGYLQ